MDNKIIVLDNLVQPHSSGIIGLTQKVKALCPPDFQPEEITLRAKRQADEFKKMFQ